MRIRHTFPLLLMMLCTAPVVAQQTEISYASTEVAPGLYMLEGKGGFAGGNLGLLTGEDGVVLIDDGLPPLTDVLLAAVGTLTRYPVEFVINTHVHGDHVGGNAALAGKGATIVAHDNLRRRMINDSDGPAAKAALPVVTFADSVTFHLNGREARVFHIERAHTDGDAVIHFPEANVIHTGDIMFNGIFPFIDLDSGGTVAGYIAGQKKILAMADERTKIIPGHGPLATAADLRASITMLEDATARVRALIDAGKTEEQILSANPLAAYDEKWNWQFITTERMTKTIYQELAR